MGKITILYLLSAFNEENIYFNQLVEGLDKDRYRPIICYLRGPTPDKTVLKNEGYPVITFPYSKKDLRSLKFGLAVRIRNILKEEGVDIIHAYRHKPTIYAALAALGLAGVKIISSAIAQNQSRSIMRRFQNRLLLPRVDAIVSVSEAVRRDVLEHNPCVGSGKVKTVYCTIDLKRFSAPMPDKREARHGFGLPVDKWIWGSVGRLVPVKGHDILFRAFSVAGLAGMGGHVAVAGDGRLRGELERMAEGLGLAGHVTFLGRVDDIPGFLAGVDGFVFPSRNEGLGLALVEALASGAPCVGSDVGGISEVLGGLDKKGYAILVPPGDPSALASAMKEVMSWDKDRKAAAAKAGRERALDFDIVKMMEEMDRMYQGLHEGVAL